LTSSPVLIFFPVVGGIAKFNANTITPKPATAISSGSITIASGASGFYKARSNKSVRNSISQSNKFNVYLRCLTESCRSGDGRWRLSEARKDAATSIAKGSGDEALDGKIHARI